MNIHEQQAFTFVHFSDVARNWHFRRLINVNIIVAPPLDPQTFDKQRKILKRYKRSKIDWIGELGVREI